MSDRGSVWKTSLVLECTLQMTMQMQSGVSDLECSMEATINDGIGSRGACRIDQ